MRRPEVGAIRLQERDVWILEAVAKMRFLTTTHLAKLAFAESRWAANKRLRKLLDAGLIRVWVRDLAKDNVYSLTRAGVRVLEEKANDDGVPRVPRGLDGNLDHLLTINQVRIAVALGLSQAEGELRWWRSDWEFSRHGRQGLVPDALFAVRWNGESEHVFALEVENRSNSRRAFVRKVLRYAAWRRRSDFGPADFVILVVVRDPQWMERYRLALGCTREELHIWFTTLEALEKKGVKGRIWKTTGREENYSLRDLTSLPYGKEGRNLQGPTLSGSSEIHDVRRYP